MNFLRVLPGALALIAVLLLAACANIGNPTGGPRDETPPKLVAANPPQGALNVSKDKIQLTFNELVNVRDAFQNVVVSPSSKSTPRVTSLGRKVTVEFDSLAPNTTYTVDFGNAVEDVNEANRLQGFSYTFSTGPVLDSLRISGRVFSARDLEPQQSMIVGVYDNLADSAFKTQRLLRVAKTDDRGQFTIRGLAPGSYRVFALGDKDNDMRYSSPEEDIAFLGSVVVPSSRPMEAFDTVRNPITGAVDTVTPRTRTQFLPNDLVLRTFNSELRQQYLSKYERLDSTRVFLKFNTRAHSLPRISVLGSPDITRIGTLEASSKLDSLVYWLNPALIAQDTVKLGVTYTRSDQNLAKTVVTDTLDFITKRIKVKKKSKKPDLAAKADSIAKLLTAFAMPASGDQEVWKPFAFESPAPLEHFDTAAVRLLQLVDTVYRPVASHFRILAPDSLKPRQYELHYSWDYDTKYRLEIDSLAGRDIHGLVTRPVKHDFTTKRTGDYCSLLFHISGIPQGEPAFVELLNQSDAVQRAATVSNSDAFFPFLAPGKYFARIVMDSNSDGLYTTGNYDLGLQPELAYYYPKAINIKKNWDKEENWDLFALPLDQMKPAVLLKNRPESTKRKSTGDKETEDDEDDDYFDPTRNPFDPNDKGHKRTTAGSY